MNTSRRWLIATAIAILATVGLAAPAAAGGAPPTVERVTITAVDTFGEPVGTFTADGDAICESGTVALVGDTTVTERPRMLTFDLVKRFTCDDGSGSFDVHIQARWSPCEPTDQGLWTIVAGTGVYAGASGHGRLVGTYFPAACAESGIVDVLTGVVIG